MNQYRKVYLVNAPSLLVAKEQFSALTLIESFIDLTQDMNQNKWLGQELADTLIFFDDKTKLNLLLSVLSCIRGGCNIYLACDELNIKSYFKKNILIPSLRQIELVDKTIELTEQTKENSKEESANIENNKLNKLLLAAKTPQIVTHLVGIRGSGKSTLLGLLINELVEQSITKIALVTQYKTSSKNTLNILNDVSRETIEFYSPNHLFQHIEKHKVILIDEAATLPRQFINKVREHVKKHQQSLVLSTTLEGYEGTGQSYRLNYLKEEHENVIWLKNAYRFSETDPIQLLSQRFCRPTKKKHKITNGEHTFDNISLREEGLTETCFSLLRDGHYKTTPNDLERFYNEPGVFVLSFLNGELVAALHALPEILPEGVLSKDIFYGRRRVKDAMTQQSLIYSYGENQQLAAKKILRISRIATETQWQRMGLASRLVKQLSLYGKKLEYDLLSTSFTITKLIETDPTLAFWLSVSFKPVRVGLTKNKWNSGYALLMLYDLAANQSLFDELYIRYCQHIVYYQSYYSLTNEQISSYLNEIENSNKKAQDYDFKQDVESVVYGHRDIHWLLPMVLQQSKNPFFVTEFGSSLSPVGTLLTGELIRKSNLANAKLLLKKCFLEKKPEA